MIFHWKRDVRAAHKAAYQERKAALKAKAAGPRDPDLKSMSRRALVGIVAALVATPLVIPPSAFAAPIPIRAKRAPGSGPAIPASINAPVVGTDLTSIWNKQFGGTGPQNAPLNTWAGWPDAYLISVGFTMGGGGLALNAGTGTVNVARYDFAGAPIVLINGTSGVVNLTDCYYGNTAVQGVVSPYDSNGNIQFTGTLSVNHIQCSFNYANSFTGSGTTTYTTCKFSNQPGPIGGSGVSAGPTHFVFDGCYIPGGGCAPGAGQHVEYIQQIPTVPAGSSCEVKNCMIDCAANGQATLSNWGSAWTALWSLQVATITFTNNVIIGILAVNSNTNNSQRPNVIPYILAYGGPSCIATFTNNCFENPGGSGGFGGYTNGGGTGIDGGGNRNFNSNTQITVF